MMDKSNFSSSNSDLDVKIENDRIVSNELIRTIIEKFPTVTKLIYNKPNRSKFVVNNESLVEIAIFLRDHYGLDHAESISGTDYPSDNEIEINYHLGSYVNQDLHPYILNISTRVNRDNPKSNSLINIFPSVEYFERETYEMLGVYFVGHPRNERFLLPEDWADLPPLRKDFKLKGR
jgi:NADH:ubiquinone oxidoreductase subunit C